VNTTLDHNTLPTGAAVHTLGKRVEGDPEYEGQWWEIEFVVLGQGVEVWSRGFLPEADTIPYRASRIPLEWGRDLWAGLARSGFSVIYPSYRKA
jgi:hypothetical protein